MAGKLNALTYVLVMRMLSGNSSAKLCNGVRAVCCQISNFRWYNHQQLLGGEYVLPRIACLPGEQLGSSSADHQSTRSANDTALLVIHGNIVQFCNLSTRKLNCREIRVDRKVEV